MKVIYAIAFIISVYACCSFVKDMEYTTATACGFLSMYYLISYALEQIEELIKK